MKKLLKLAFVAVLATGMVACGSNGENTEQAEQVEESHEGHDHDGHDHADHAEGTTGDFMIDTENSEITWKGGVMKIGGEFVKSHNGTIAVSQGKVAMSNGQIAAGKLTIDMNSMEALDDNFNVEEGSTREKLIGHLTSADFFNVEEFPNANFSFTVVEGKPVAGTMTIRGISNEEALTDMVIDETEGVITISGTLTIDRQKYGVAYDMGAKDVLISDDIELGFTIMTTADTEEMVEVEEVVEETEG